ncbi:hypothetical protein [Azospirillum picis]|uniref:Radical SAM protein n=1 Tax=Azospirillum picis TaxID=488438 RepID=A0ABU0MS08_9PROT|nr:hypothetical protein [Azospirillum picis]MBP2302547.1 hypothetical protein [Azospirillum picis]MDQ0536211.1 hypothetical protein [Azospirillum picis]
MAKAPKWSKGLAEWVDGDTAYLSIAFTWLLDEAYRLAIWHRACGRRVVAGGPALFQEKVSHILHGVAEIPVKRVTVDGREVVRGADFPDAVARHNPLATFASRGCPVGCYFCIVPKMEGRSFTLLPDFTPRPILCDNNLSGLPADYQDFIVDRYRKAEVPLLDANSGFEPKTFDADVYARWRDINKGPWRFAYDEQGERSDVERVMQMLRSLPAKRKRVYVLIGNEPMAACLERIKEVIAWGGEPHVQPYIKLNAMEKVPHVRFDWTRQALTDMARWANRRIWRKCPDFSDYRRSEKASRKPFADDIRIGDLMGGYAHGW